VRRIGLFEKICECQGEGNIVWRVASGYEELSARAAEVVMGDEELRELEADVAAADDSVSLPGAVDGGAIVVDGGLHVVFLCGKPGEAEVDETVAGLSLPQTEEVVIGLFGMARFAEGLGEQELVGALAGGVREGGAEGDDSLFGMAGVDRGLASGRPAQGQLLAVGDEGPEEEERDEEQDDGDKQQAEEGQGVAED